VNFDLVFEVCIKLLSCSRPPSISNHFIYMWHHLQPANNQWTMV